MNFDYTPEQKELKEVVVKFAQKELNDKILERDENSEFSFENWRKCAEFGILGASFPKEFGGSEYDILTTMVLMEAMGSACLDHGLLFSLNAQMWSIQMPLLMFAQEHVKRHYLPRLISGEIIGGHGMSEPGSGSDSSSLKTTAIRDGNKYILNGSKIFVTNAPIADVFVIFAITDKSAGFMGISGFIVDKESKGISLGQPTKKMGLRTSPMSEVYMDAVRVPADNCLGKEGQGADIFKHSIEWERGCILASQIGAMQYQLESNIEYIKTRKQFKKSIGKFQSVSNRIVDMYLRLETSRLLLYKLAKLKESQGHCPLESAAAKLYLSENFHASCLDSIRNLGGYGFMKDYHIERYFRDSVGGLIYSGTSDIQRNLIAKYLGL